MHAKWNALPILGYNCVVEDKLDKEGKKTLGKSQLSANRDAKKGYFARPNTHIGACRLCPIYIIYGGKFLVTFRGAHSKQNWTPLKTASQPTKLDEEGEFPLARGNNNLQNYIGRFPVSPGGWSEGRVGVLCSFAQSPSTVRWQRKSTYARSLAKRHDVGCMS